MAPGSSEDPFASAPAERTFVMPTPGMRTPKPVQASGGADVASDFPAVSVGLNPLVALANSVLALVPQLRATTHHANPPQLREQIAHAIREFERRARAEGIAAERVMAARYVLCTVIDEVAANTPWGGSGAWARHSLLVAFHNEAWGGEKVFQLMAKLAENVKANRDLLELIYASLALGFQGRYQVVQGGGAQLDSIRERLAQLLLKERGSVPRALSENWQSVVKTRNPLASWLPVWASGAATAALLLVAYLALSASLAGHADPVEAAIRSIHVQAPVIAQAPAPKPAPAVPPRLGAFLADEVARGLVAVRDEADRSVVTIRGDGLFQPGAADLVDERLGVMQRIGTALAQTPGKVIVTGHTDSQPIHTLRFPSNWALSDARARSVAEILARDGVTTDRIRTEGWGAQRPVATNDTASDRALNRRVEITLLVGR